MAERTLSRRELRNELKKASKEALDDSGFLTEEEARRIIEREVGEVEGVTGHEDDGENGVDAETGWSRSELKEQLPDELWEDIVSYLDEHEDENLGKVEKENWSRMNDYLDAREAQERESRDVPVDNPSTELMDLSGLTPAEN